MDRIARKNEVRAHFDRIRALVSAYEAAIGRGIDAEDAQGMSEGLEEADRLRVDLERAIGNARRLLVRAFERESLETLRDVPSREEVARRIAARSGGDGETGDGAS
jgi:hypothetical protein